MPLPRRTVSAVFALVAIPLLATPAWATSLVRLGLEQLAQDNATIVQATVLDIHSYWNPAHTFILTDVHVRASKHFKGDAADELAFTLLGGTVGETTTLIVGGPALEPGSEYVLFLATAGLPGTAARLTVRDLCQGVFAVRHGRAFSEALFEPLLPDANGLADVPGGAEGLPLETLGERIVGSR